MRRAVGLIAVLAACTAGASGMGHGRGSAAADTPGLGGDDRVLVTEFANVTGLAASQRLLFVASSRGLAILDRQFERWLPPLATTDGYPAGRVSALAADPIEDAVWIGTAGALVYYRPALDYLTSTIVPGVVDAIFFDSRDPGAGAYVRGAGQWSLVTRTGFASPVAPGTLPPPASRVVTPTLRDLYREFPSLHSFGGLLTRDDAMRSWPVSAGTRAPDRAEVWLGTAGNGIYRVDPLFNQSQHVAFGLLDAGAAALALAADGIWVAGIAHGADARGGLTFARDDLQSWRWVEAPLTRPLSGAAARDLVVRENTAWLATTQGLVALDTQDGDAQEWMAASGLPTDEALSVAATSAGVWVGTARGLVVLGHTDGERSGARDIVSSPLLNGTPIRALLFSHDTLWIGSDAGLLLLSPVSPEARPRRAAIASLDSRLARPIRAVARSDSVLAVATADELVLLDLASKRPLPVTAAAAVNGLRGVTATDMDAQTVFVTGLAGLIVLDRATGVSRVLTAPGDIPDEAYDVRLTPEYAWVATRRGLLRLRRLPGGMIR